MSDPEEDPTVRSFEQIPVEDSKRKRTDICCIIANTAFVVILLIVALSAMNLDNLRKISYPNDVQGNTCGFDSPKYPYLYWTSTNDPKKRLCVNKCPKEGDKQLSCQSTDTLSCYENNNPKYEVQIYDSELEETRIGLFCMPTDEDTKTHILDNSGIKQKYNFLAFYDAMWASIWITVIFAVVILLLIQFLPLYAVPWLILLGGIILILFGILTIMYSLLQSSMATGSIFLRILAMIVSIGLGVACLFTIFNSERRSSIFVGARLIKIATMILKKAPLLLIYIPIFMAFFGLLMVLIGFQLLAFWSFGEVTFVPEKPFHEINGFMSHLFSFLCFVEFLWGLSFLKQAFNFCVSGYAIQYYFYDRNNQSKMSVFHGFKLLVCNHYGSVMGGSIFLGVFYIIDFILDFFFTDDKEKKTHQFEIQEKRNYENLEHTPTNFFGLVRSESMAYINAISVPYCNASRYVQMMSIHSDFYDYGQSTNRVFRMCAHVFVISIVCLISLGSMKGNSGVSDIGGVLLILVISFFTLTFFISLHGDLAEGILTGVFIEETFNKGNVNTPNDEVIDAYNDDIQGKYKGKSIPDMLLRPEHGTGDNEGRDDNRMK